MNNNSNNSACSFTESLVDYLYGECAAAERVRLEKHLSGCSECSVRLEEIGEARFAVAEWKDFQFAPLPTPNIEFLPEKSRKTTGSLAKFSELLASLVPMPRLATVGAGLAILLAITGGFLIVSFHDNLTETAVNDSGPDKNSVTIDQTQTPGLDRSRQISSSDVASVKASPTANNTGKDSSGSLREKNKHGAPRRTVTKTPVQNETAVTISKRPARELPRLNDFEDYQDNSLRLSDILDEIDSGK